MIHYGDITKIKGAEVPLVDIVTGGSPCQDLSIAGKRQGLAGERSGLFMEQIRVIKELRDESRKRFGTDDPRRIVPRFMVWENVPGAFSSNNGEDFRAVLEETARIADKAATIPRPAEKKGKLQWSTSGCIMGDGWSIAWRVHDAQFWGVPQRRKRIALVADFAGGGAPEILFECESLYGNTETSREEKQGTTTDAERCFGETSESLSFQERAGKEGGGKGILIQKERTGALSTLNAFGNGESRTPTVVLENHPNDSRVKIREDGIVQTLSSRMGTGGGNVPMVISNDCETDIKCLNDQQAVLYTIGHEESVVRRLTPLECERLQGFPDNWTNIGDWVDSKGKTHKGDADSPRYKALGNSIALPFWQWMAERMVRLIKNDEPEKEPTMASLFSGIGGFELVFARAGCKPVFSSEIEEFPITVVKKHFGDDDTGEVGDYERYL